MVIDFQIHFEPEEFIRPYLGPGDSLRAEFDDRGRTVHFAFKQRFDVEHHLKVMDEAGVDVAVLSSMEGLAGDLHKSSSRGLPRPSGMKTAAHFQKSRVVNDRAKMWAERFPGRIKAMAHIPPFGGAEAFAELMRCAEALGFKGAAIRSAVAGKEVDDPAFWPFYEKLCELDMFLFIHPGYPRYASEDAGIYYDLMRSASREGHLQAVLVRLINGGVLDDFPTLKIVMSHLGGGFAANLQRIISYQDKEFWGSAGYPLVARKCKRDFREYLPMIYFDTGGIIADVDAVKMALMKLSPKNIVFGTDYPMEIRDGKTIKGFIEGIRALPLKPADIDAMLGGNGRALIGV